MTVRQAVWVITCLFVLAIVVYPTLRYLPKREALRRINQEIEAKRAMLKKPAAPATDGELERLRLQQAQLTEQLTDAKAEFAWFKAKLLPDHSAERTQFVLMTISQLADGNGVRLRDSTWYDSEGETEPLSPLAEILLQDTANERRLHRLSLESSFAGFRGLLGQLNQSLPGVLIVHFAIESPKASADAGGGIDITLILAI
jgi:hypothetical protein